MLIIQLVQVCFILINCLLYSMTDFLFTRLTEKRTGGNGMIELKIGKKRKPVNDVSKVQIKKKSKIIIFHSVSSRVLPNL